MNYYGLLLGTCPIIANKVSSAEDWLRRDHEVSQRLVEGKILPYPNSAM